MNVIVHRKLAIVVTMCCRLFHHTHTHSHIMEHLKGAVDIDAVAAGMSSQEVQFHYFHSHDTDRDKRLDGLELMQSVRHVDGEWTDGHHEATMSEENIVEIVDHILAEDDMNKDGYVDYVEFSRETDLTNG